MKTFPIIFLILLSFTHSIFAQEDVEKYIKKSNELRNENKYSEAIDEINKAIKIQPQNSLLYLRRAGIFEVTRDFESFSNDLLKTIELAPNDLQTYLTAIHLYLRHQKCEQALNIADDAVIKFPSDARIYGERFRVKTCLNDPSGAMTNIEKAISLDPLNEMYKQNRANLLNRVDRKKESLESYNQIITRLELKFSLEKNPDWRFKNDLSFAYISRSRIFAKNNELEKSFADLNRAIEVNPIFYTYRTRAKAYQQQKMYDKALADLNQAIEIDNSEDAGLYIDRGDVFFLMERYEEALKDYEYVLKSGRIRPIDSIERRINGVKKKIQQKDSQNKPK